MVWVSENYIWLPELGYSCPLLQLYMFDLKFTVQESSMKHGPGHTVDSDLVTYDILNSLSSKS